MVQDVRILLSLPPCRVSTVLSMWLTELMQSVSAGLMIQIKAPSKLSNAPSFLCENINLISNNFK